MTMKPTATWLMGCGAIVLNGALAMAHHSFDAEYDSTKPFTVTGIVTKLD